MFVDRLLGETVADVSRSLSLGLCLRAFPYCDIVSAFTEDKFETFGERDRTKRIVTYIPDRSLGLSEECWESRGSELMCLARVEYSASLSESRIEIGGSLEHPNSICGFDVFK